ncbi:hypothetical protein TOPH_08937 [Tolypocladium ophioglossoides CBS 100239]|uniref:Uncharacterized protein n=1 Tax=Tolypocladium ophioglossoides (strain CBS 100239) TaxID=1163406 RepID=A0A0L0MY88_TOLOC|nr:hypothetical protein TOPH_08937 [Tolypocladium ophioglossoides CBS 100239]
MAEAPQQASWALVDLLMPHSSLLVRAISFVCLALGTIFILPLFFLLAYDLSLWIWRHSLSLFSTRGIDSVPAAAPGDPSSSFAATTATDAQRQESKQTRKR